MMTIEETGSVIVAKIFKTLWESAKNPPRWIKDKYQARDPFGLEAKKYVAHINDTYNSMRIIGMSEPSPIDDIYINVYVRDNNSFSDIISDFFWEQDEPDFVRDEEPKTYSAQNVVAEKNRVLILGRPGAGKTTFLKYLAISSLKNSKLTHIPVFISLKEWSQTKIINLETAVFNQFEACQFYKNKEFVRNLLRKGKCLLLLDGFDEIDPEFRSAAIAQIKSFVNEWGGNKYVLSCRTAANIYVFDRFTEIEVADFDKNQINVFVQKWFKNKRIAEKFLDELMSPETRGLCELAKNPLLLTLICIAYQESLSFPDSRVQLYQYALDALLRKWDSTRDIIRFNPYKGLTVSKKELLLSRIAVKSVTNDTNVYRICDVSETIDEFMEEIAYADNYDDPASVIDAIESQHGIIYKLGDQRFVFSHLTFQEYYIARFIIDSNDDEILKTVLAKYIGEPSWNEILTICCGLQRDSSSFLYNYKSVLEKKRSENFEFLREIATTTVVDTGEYPNVLRILLAMSQVLNSAADKNPIRGELNSMASITLLASKAASNAYLLDVNMEVAAIKVTGLGMVEGRRKVEMAGDQIVRLEDSWASIQTYLFGLYVFCICLSNEATVTKSYKKRMLDSLMSDENPLPPRQRDNPFIFKN